jgi:ABC-type phosphate transport system permease subunit
VVPLGVIAALYLREYAKQGVVVSVIRIAINNLAGVPSIVYGMFGLGFFCYAVGGYVDGGPEDAASRVSWWMVVVGLVAMVGLAGGVSVLIASARGGVRRVGGLVCGLLWMATVVAAAWLIATTPYFGGFFAEKLPEQPTFGGRGILWASLTLALLTLPVVIVATEEAIAAVPNSMREGSFGCGASRWQTVRRIVLPSALPGIMTGAILAMARGAGEVAPLMLVGAVNLAPAPPVSGEFPFVHGDRTFMHLGFHIYNLGFQSPDAEATEPLVWTTALLLVAIVLALNLTAVIIRARLRLRSGSAV